MHKARFRGGIEVGIENFVGDVFLVRLPLNPYRGDELEALNEMASQGCERDVIIDLSAVRILTSESICSLMILDKYLSTAGRQLVFCGASPEIMHVFERTGLASVFEFADNEYAALQHLQRCSSSYS